MKIIFLRETEINPLNPHIADIKPLGATETCFISLAKELAVNNEVKVCCPCNENKIYNNVEYIPFISYKNFLEYCKTINPHFIIVVGNPAILFKNIPLEFNYIFWQHNHPLELKHFPINNLLPKPKSVKIVVPSPEACEFTKKYYHDDNNIYGIYNGVRSIFFEQQNVEKQNNRIIYTGALYKHKGVLDLLRYVECMQDFEFYICGSFDMYGNEHQDFKNLCMSYLKNKNLFFLGGLDKRDLVKEIQKSTLSIVNPLVGNKEVCCVNALETMASKVAVIAGGNSIIDPIIAHGGLSYTRDLVNVVRTLMLNEQKRNLLINSGNEWVQQLTWTNIAKQWQKLFEELYAVGKKSK